MKTGPKSKTALQAVQRALEKAVREGECLLLKEGQSVGIGYKMLSFEGKQDYAHRTVYQVKKRKLLVGEIVRHSCDHPNCIEESHLLAGTHTENVKDKVDKQRHCFGSDHYASKLNEQAVLALRAIDRPDFEELSRKLDMSVGALKSAYYGHTWKHVQTRAKQFLGYITSAAYVEQ